MNTDSKTKAQNDSLENREKISVDIKALKGGRVNMSTIMDSSLFNKEVIGLKELRNNLSEVIGRAVNKFEDLITGNVKTGDENTATIISTKVLEDILSAYKFNPYIKWDEETKQYEAAFDEIHVYGYGDTKEDAIQVLIETLIDDTEDYFKNLEINLRIPQLKQFYPYYLRIKHCNNIDELMRVLNLIN